MIRYTKGDLLQSEAQALVNTVNTVGVMGKGLALQFKTAYPDNYRLYRKACEEHIVTVGQMFVTEVVDVFGTTKIIVNFPTKTTWRKPSEYSYIESGLKALRRELLERDIQSIAIPPLGSRNGGLDWEQVRMMIERELADLDCDIVIYEPSDIVIEKLNGEKAKLTPARAMLLDVICDLVANGEFASEFAAEKIAYFLQRFGASDVFHLQYKQGYYGPYSGKVRYVLQYLNGSYVMGVGELQQKPFEEIWILANTAADTNAFLERQGNERYRKISNDVKSFLSGYYSNFTLELLATLDFILINDERLYHWEERQEDDVVAMIMNDLALWSNRKEKMFGNPDCVKMALQHIRDTVLNV